MGTYYVFKIDFCMQHSELFSKFKVHKKALRFVTTIAPIFTVIFYMILYCSLHVKDT